MVDGLSVADNIALGNEARRGPFIIADSTRADASQLMARIGFHDMDPGSRVGSLSVAEKQGVMIARALRLNSRVIVMDEATSALTGEEVGRLFSLIRQLKGEGNAVIFVSHRLRELAEIGDRVTVFKDGRRIDTVPAATPPAKLVRLMVGRTVGGFPHKDRSIGDVVLDAKHLSTDRLRDVNFQVSSGEIVGLAGLVGSGRTELLRALFGVDRLRTGTLELDGRPVRLRTAADAIKGGIALVPEDRRSQGIVGARSVGENLLMVWSMFNRRQQRRERPRDVAQRLRDELAIKTPTLDQRISLLSGGNQQKAVVGKWLAIEPRILLLDEPTKGIDVGAKMEVFKIVDRLARSGMGVVLVSSELPEILGMCDRICVMREGQIVGEFSSDVTEEDIIAAAMGEEK